MKLDLIEVCKSFGHVPVLQHVSLHLEAGMILGLVGENGAGKSTLMNIIGGIFPPETGRMEIDGRPFAPMSAKDSREAGIAFIHQTPNLFSNLTIAENLLLQHYPQKKTAGLPLLDHPAAKARSRELLKEVGLDLSPGILIEQLSSAQQQLVEIAKAIGDRPRLIIFDEPTTSLSRLESENLFRLIRRLKNNGIAMIFISHQLDDVLALSDRIAILRDGRLVMEKARSELDLQLIIRQMIGREMAAYYPAKEAQQSSGAGLLDVRGLRSVRHPQAVSFEVNSGEIVGCYGLIGAGRSELARLVFGLDPYLAGNIYWKGQVMSTVSPAAWIRRKVAFLTENRHAEGLFLSQSILQNIGLAALPGYARSPLRWIDRLRLRDASAAQAEATRIRYQDLEDQPVATLSGGNQQKVVLARWLLTSPELLILDEPTKGIDIGARQEIYRLIHELAAAGAGIWLISSDIEELLGLCDRILVMSKGRISAAFGRADFERAAILEAALPEGEKA